VVDDRGLALADAKVEAGGSSTVTDGRGRFRIEFATADVGDLRATHPAHFAASTPLARLGTSGADLSLRLDRRLAVTGTVLDALDKPAAEASIRAVVLEPGLGGPPEGAPAQAALSGNPWHATDLVAQVQARSDGSFSLADLRPGRYLLQGDAPTGPVQDLPLSLHEDRHDVLLRVLGGRLRVRGTVRDCATGEPLDASMGIGSYAAGDPNGCSTLGGPTDGNFGMAFWSSAWLKSRPFRVLLGFAREGYEPRFVEVSPRAPDLESLRVCLDRRRAGSGSLVGTILLDDGAPFEPPCEVRAWRPFDERPGRIQVGADGSFLVEDLEPGDLAIQPDIPGQTYPGFEEMKVVRIDPGTAVRVNWALARGGGLRCEATDGAGGRLEDFEVTLEDPPKRRIFGKSDAGAVHFRHIPPGLYRLLVRADGIGEHDSIVNVEGGHETGFVAVLRAAGPAER
jgi:hypothetical protein